MCPQCRAFISTQDRVCPYCDTPLGERAIDRRLPEAVAGFIPGDRLVTSILLLINFVMFGLTVMLSYGQGPQSAALQSIDRVTLIVFGAKWAPGIVNGQWWRLVTAGFLHGGLIHILINSVSLFDLGQQVEERFGVRRYLVIYFVSTVVGFWASTWWSPAVPSVGASAGIFGLIGAMIALGTGRHASARLQTGSNYLRWAGYSLLLGFVLPNIDNAAHVGGLAGGFVTAYLAGTPKLSETAGERLWRALAWLCVLITGLSFALMLQSFLAYGRG